jgi:hypothetical protein
MDTTFFAEAELPMRSTLDHDENDPLHRDYALAASGHECLARDESGPVKGCATTSLRVPNSASVAAKGGVRGVEIDAKSQD